MTTSPTTSTTLRTQPAHPFAQRVDSADWEAVTAEVGADGRCVRSMTPGRLGGHRRKVAADEVRVAACRYHYGR